MRSEPAASIDPSAATPAGTPGHEPTAPYGGLGAPTGGPARATTTLAARRLAVARGIADDPGGGAARRHEVARLTSAHLRIVWGGATAGLRTDGLALACVGSLAREESGPLSDLDLVLLHDGRTDPGRVAAVADALWYPLWESGLRLDHSVRTPADCRAVAEADLPALVGLLDLVTVAGDPTLVAGARSGVARDWRAAARRRLPEVIEEVRARHLAHGALAEVLEPDLKAGKGGLRDVALMRALTASWLADRSHAADVAAAAQRLLDVRDAVHVVGGRPRERLFRQDRDTVSALLGYAASDDLLAAVSDAGRLIALATDATVRRAEQGASARRLRVGPRVPALRPLGHGVYQHEGEAVLGPDAARRLRSAPEGDPLVALRVCVAAARAGLPLAPATVATVAATDWAATWTPARRELFTRLLAAGPGLRHVWEQLTVAGVVDRWIPGWAGVRSRPQHDPVHRYTVDRHQIETVVMCVPALDEVARPDLLVVAALLHDLGKAGAGPEHPAVGAPLARTAATSLGFPAVDADRVALLVAHHLTLIDLATTRDPADARTLEALLEAVEHDRDTLGLLAALTRADAASVGGRAWTPWRARLVDDLVGRARARLDRPHALGEAADGGRVWLEGTASTDGVLDPGEEAASAGDRAAASAGHPVVRVRPGDDADTAVVEVIAADRLGLFADVAGALAAQGVAVRRAVLRTHEGIARDTWECDAEPAALDATRVAGFLHAAATTRSVRAGSGRSRAGARPQVLVLHDASTTGTVVELRGADRPGLLRDIGRALAEAGVSVLRAHVETYAGRCRDVFVLSVDGRPLDPPTAARAVGAVIDAAG